MDTTSAVTDGDGLIFHYRAGLYKQTMLSSELYPVSLLGSSTDLCYLLLFAQCYAYV